MRQQIITRRVSGTGWFSALLLLVFVVLNSAVVSAAPSITANPNPVNVPNGETQAKTTITWNTEGISGFVWLSIDGGDEKLVTSEITRGSIEIAVTLGKSYELRLYTADRERLLASVIVKVIAEASKIGGPLRNPRNSTEDLDIKRTDKAYLYGQQVRELRCRGGAGAEINENAQHYVMWEFVRATVAVDPKGQNLAPGQCGWTDRAMRDDEDNTVFQATDQKRENIVKIDPDPGISNAERFPNVVALQTYLKDPNNYWSFFVRATIRQEWFAEYSRRWIPIKSSTIEKGPRRIP